MKLFFDFLPVLLFFLAFKLAGIYVATAVAMVTALLQAGWLWTRHRRIERSQLAVAALIVVLGALTLIFNNPDFIKWKPTVVNWLFALVLGGGLLLRRNLLRSMLGAQLVLPEFVWRRLALAWAGFFLFLGALNLHVAYGYSLDTWVSFKLYGMLGLTLAFALLQALYLARHLPDEAAEPEEE